MCACWASEQITLTKYSETSQKYQKYFEKQKKSERKTNIKGF